MKRSLGTTIFLLVLFSHPGMAQYADGKVIYEDGFELLDIKDVQVGDLNGDNFPDIVVASSDDHKISWYRNDGTGNFGSQNVISLWSQNARCVYIADLNGDTFPDVLAGSIVDNRLEWFQNDGIGNFSTPKIISISVEDITDVFAIDLDDDDDIDVISSSAGDNKIAWFENDGSGNFGLENVLSVSIPNARTVKAADLNGDDIPEIVAYSLNEYTIYYFENLGNGSFASANLISSRVGFQEDFYLEDADGDNDMDLIKWSIGGMFTTTYNGLYYLENLNGIIQDAPVFIDASFSAYTEGILAADMDGDDLVDIIQSKSIQFFDPGELAWYKNEGNGNFAARQLFGNGCYNSPVVCSGDLDRDGRIDLVAPIDNRINKLDHVDLFDFNGSITHIPIDQGTSDHIMHGTYASTLVPGREHKSILFNSSVAGTSDDVFATLPGDGQGNFGGMEVLFTAPNNSAAGAFQLCDIDNNSLKDLVLKFGDNGVVWHANDGSQYDQAGNSSSIETADNLKILDIEDLNGDELPDVLCLLDFGVQYIAALYNNGLGSFDTATILEDQFFTSDNKLTLKTGDMDNDGDADIFGAFLVDEIVLFFYENLGNGNFSEATAQAVTTEGEIGHDLKIDVADMDGDGDDEIFGTFYSAADIILPHAPPISYYNYVIYDFNGDDLEAIISYNVWPHGMASAWENNIEFDIIYADYNRDGNIDLLTLAGAGEKKDVFWLLGDGTGLFTVSIPVIDGRIFNTKLSNGGSSGPYIPTLAADDVDMDLDLDVFIGHEKSFYDFKANRLEFYENESPLQDLDNDGYDFLADCDDNNPDVGDQLPTPDLGSDLELCEGEALQFSNPNIIQGADHLWSGPDAFTSSDPEPLIDPVGVENGGTYALIVSLNDCVSPAGSVDVEVNALPVIDIVLDEPDIVTIVGESLISFQWFDLNDTIADATDSFHIAQSSGLFWASATDINGCTSISDTLSVVIISTNDQTLGYPVHVYPNPVGSPSNLNILIPNIERSLEFKLTDVKGSVIHSGNISSTIHSIPISDYPGGVYMLYIQDGKKRQVFNIAITN